MQGSFPYVSRDYQVGQNKVVSALGEMTTAMYFMGAEHSNFHNDFNQAQKRIQELKNAYAPKELDAEVVRSKALGPYISATNIPSVTALGRYEVENALDIFQKQEKELDKIRKKTAELMESLLEDGKNKKGGGHGVKAESTAGAGKDTK